MKRILFIIQSYPSERSANVLCDEAIMCELQKSNEFEIHCLTYQYNWQKRKDTINGFYIHRIKKSIFWDIYTWSRHHPEKRITRVINVMHRLNLRLKQLITIPFYPCYEPINSVLYAKAAVKLFRKFRFDLVFAEHNGFDTLYAGHKVKEYAKSKTKFIATLWDPFTGRTTAKYLPVRFAKRRIDKAEGKVLANADCIIAMHSSQNYHMRYSTNKPYFDRFRFLDFPRLVKPKIEHGIDAYTQSDMINLLYAGLLYVPGRNPSFLIDCINRATWPKPVNLIFLCSGNGTTVLMEKEQSFKGRISIHGYVSQDELHLIMNNVDGFINIGSDNPGMAPSKIFEYMSFGKPIISSFIDDKDASLEYLKEYPLAVCLTQSNPEKLNDLLLSEFINRKLSQQLSFDQVASRFQKNTPALFVAAIKDLIENN